MLKPDIKSSNYSIDEKKYIISLEEYINEYTNRLWDDKQLLEIVKDLMNYHHLKMKVS